MLIVLTTCPDGSEAQTLAKSIVNSRLAACVQVLPKMTSVYIWENEVREESEHLLLIKTLPERWNELKNLILAEHSYSVPDIVAFESTHVLDAYSEWISTILETE